MSQSVCFLCLILLLHDCYWLARDAKELSVLDKFLTSSCNCSTSSFDIWKGMLNQSIDRLTRKTAQKATTRNRKEVRWYRYWDLGNSSSYSMYRIVQLKETKSIIVKWSTSLLHFGTRSFIEVIAKPCNCTVYTVQYRVVQQFFTFLGVHFWVRAESATSRNKSCARSTHTFTYSWRDYCGTTNQRVATKTLRRS